MPFDGNTMKATFLFVLVLVCLQGAPLHAQEEEFPDAPFFVGAYTLIGKALESNDAFLGKLLLTINDDSTKSFERIIDGTTTRGSWAIEYALGNEIRVIRIRWTNEGRRYECTYQWCMDFDTYPRLSGHCYETGKATDSPGMEVAFIIHEEPPEEVDDP